MYRSPRGRALRQHGPQLGRGWKKPLRCLQSKRVALGPVQPLQSPDLPLEVGMILTACQAQPPVDHSQGQRSSRVSHTGGSFGV